MNKARSHLLDVAGVAELIEPLTELVIRAGAAILAVNRSAMKVEGKLDGSPVTEADLAADRVIGEGLARSHRRYRRSRKSACIWRRRRTRTASS